MRLKCVEMLPARQKPRIQHALNTLFADIDLTRMPIHAVSFEALVAKVVPCVICVVHSHISDQIPSKHVQMYLKS